MAMSWFGGSLPAQCPPAWPAPESMVSVVLELVAKVLSGLGLAVGMAELGEGLSEDGSVAMELSGCSVAELLGTAEWDRGGAVVMSGGDVSTPKLVVARDSYRFDVGIFPKGVVVMAGSDKGVPDTSKSVVFDGIHVVVGSGGEGGEGATVVISLGTDDDTAGLDEGA